MITNSSDDSFDEDLFPLPDSNQDIFEIESDSVPSGLKEMETSTTVEKRGVKRNLNFGSEETTTSCKVPIKQIESYVFLDFETTGLFKLDIDRNRPELLEDPIASLEYFKTFIDRENVVHPRIVEIGMIAVGRTDFQETVSKIKRNEDFKSITRSVFSCPVFHELVGEELDRHLLQIQPAPEVLTFSDRRSFREEWPGVKHFLDGLKNPICFVAHNGLKFDFRVLLAEMKRAGLDARRELGKCFFADSIFAFKSVDQSYLQHIKTVVDSIDFTKIKFATRSEVERTENVELTRTIGNICKTPDRLPPKLIPRTAPPKICPRGVEDDLLESDHPFNFLKINNWPLAIKARFKNSFLRKDPDDWIFNETSYRKFNKSFSQSYLYQTVFRESFCAHTAINDCEALLRLCLAFETVQYFDKSSAMLFNH